MKTKTFSLLASGLIVFMLTAAALFKTGNWTVNKTSSSNRTGKDKEDTHMCCVGRSGTSTLSGNSIYQLQSNWRKQDGGIINLSHLKGKVEIIVMFYSHCTYACPLTINDMKKIESNLPANLEDKVGFVLVSFDPKRDTPKALKVLAEEQQLDEHTWKLLSGKESEIRSLAEVLGVEYKKKSNGDFLHSSQITVLNSQGEIVYKHFGLNQSIVDIVQNINALLKQN